VPGLLELQRPGRVDRAAALHRHARQLSGAHVLLSRLTERPVLRFHRIHASEQSNPANFYLAAPANYYAQFWHANAINNRQYGFPYNDDAGQSSDISVTNPQYLVVAVGW
jgi:Beta-1,3-glucanase